MAIERNTYTDILFDALMAAGCTIYGACAAMGNIYAESGANPRNLENLCEKKLNYKYTDDTYTEAVDSGKITRALFLEVTQERVDKLLEECHRIFDDKSEGNEMLVQKASELFEEE